MTLVLLAVLAYLLGGIPWGVLMARAWGERRLRERGSGNIGATNVWRVVGKTAGLLTLLGDAGKGALAVWMAKRWLPPEGVALCGFLAILGHVFSPLLRLRGGKGVATSLGVFCALGGAVWSGVAAGAAAFALALALLGYVSVASMCAVATLCASLFLLPVPAAWRLLGMGTLLLIVERHRPNLDRLRRGVEPKFRGRPAGPPPR